MNYFSRNKTKFALAVAAGISLLLIALWQLNLFLLYPDTNNQSDAQTGASHLWWAIASSVLAAIIVFSVFSILVHDDSDNKKHVISKIKAWKIGR